MRKSENICNFATEITKWCDFTNTIMAKLAVYNKGIYAGELERTDACEYLFIYDHTYRLDSETLLLCLNMPKSQPVYRSSFLFPVFTNMLAEGYNRRLQSQLLGIDENDDFASLASTA